MDDPALPLIPDAPAPAELVVLAPDGVAAWRETAGPAAADWLDFAGFKGEAGQHAAIPAAAAGRDLVVSVAAAAEPGAEDDPWGFAFLPFALPARDYRLAAEPALPPETARRLALGWAIGGYRFQRYKSAAARAPARLVWPAGVDRDAVARAARALWWARDLINTPAEDLGPGALEAAALALGERYGATAEVIRGDDLLAANYPLIHAVGRASDEAPRLVDLRWGAPTAPTVAILGKGVCFDTGGLDLKPAGGMLTMKKDMGGAASALALAAMVMDAGLALQLRVLVPMVENAVSGNAMRPLDVVKSRQGLTVEIGNTDAEGRLILADALTAASADRPRLIVDFATLTGAQRVALGFELPGLFANDDRLADRLVAAGRRCGDPLWRLPLWPPYRRLLRSSVADIANVAESPYAGAIVAALFLERFVGEGIAWAHIDHAGWTLSDRPGRPKGGEGQGMRAVFEMLAEDYPAA